MAELDNVRCFSFEAKDDMFEDQPWAAMGTFQEWVLEHTPRIEAFKESTPRLARCADRLQHLKLVEMQAHAFVRGVSRAAVQLPALETLFLHVCDHVQEEINVLGCQNLQRLVVRGMYVQPVLCEPMCQIGIHFEAYTYREPWVPVQQN